MWKNVSNGPFHETTISCNTALRHQDTQKLSDTLEQVSFSRSSHKRKEFLLAEQKRNSLRSCVLRQRYYNTRCIPCNCRKPSSNLWRRSNLGGGGKIKLFSKKTKFTNLRLLSLRNHATLSVGRLQRIMQIERYSKEPSGHAASPEMPSVQRAAGMINPMGCLW